MLYRLETKEDIEQKGSLALKSDSLGTLEEAGMFTHKGQVM